LKLKCSGIRRWWFEEDAMSRGGMEGKGTPGKAIGILRKRTLIDRSKGDVFDIGLILFEVV